MALAGSPLLVSISDLNDLVPGRANREKQSRVGVLRCATSVSKKLQGYNSEEILTADSLIGRLNLVPSLGHLFLALLRAPAIARRVLFASPGVARHGVGLGVRLTHGACAVGADGSSVGVGAVHGGRRVGSLWLVGRIGHGWRRLRSLWLVGGASLG